MSIIDFDNSINGQLQQQADLFNQLQSQQNRFKYPNNSIDPDVLSQGIPFTWRGKGYPITDFTVDISHDLVQHKYPNLDSARVEDMGRNPMMLKASLIFVNTIEPSPIESWIQGQLYPQAYSQFLVDMFDGSIDTLSHPTIGNIRCKALSATPKMDGKFRGGELIEAIWIETIDDDQLSQTTSTLKNIASSAKSAASQLDNQLASLSPSPSAFGVPTYQNSFSDTVNQVAGLIDTTTLAGQTTFSFISQIQFRCQSIIDACDRFNDNILGPLKLAAALLYAYAVDLFKSIAVKTQKIVKIFANRIDTTLANLAKQLNNTTDQLIQLNPDLAKSIKVPKDIAIRYYGK